MKWLIFGVILIVGTVMFIFFFKTTSQTAQGDRYTYCDGLWHEQIYHDQEVPTECMNETNTRYMVHQGASHDE